MISDKKGRLMSLPVWVDFMRTDWERRVKLDLPGTRDDLRRWGIELVDGMHWFSTPRMPMPKAG